MTDQYIRILLEHEMIKNYIRQRTVSIINDKTSVLENNYNREITKIKNDVENAFNEKIPRRIIELVPTILNDSKKMDEILLKQLTTLQNELSNKSNEIILKLSNEDHYGIVKDNIINNIKQKTNYVLHHETEKFADDRNNFKFVCKNELNKLKTEINNVAVLNKKSAAIDTNIKTLTGVTIMSVGIFILSTIILLTKKID